MSKAKHFFHLGNVSVETENINELREYVEEIQSKIGKGNEYGKHLSDFCFDVEAEYQRFHNLDPDDWSMVHGEYAPKDVVIMNERESIWSEIRDSFEDDGILHIDAWKTEDEEEDGRTIAKINLTTGEVEYLDERARTDESAQETIQWNVSEILKKT